jgi:membrane protease YdiL (CAAX protease family)
MSEDYPDLIPAGGPSDEEPPAWQPPTWPPRAPDSGPAPKRQPNLGYSLALLGMAIGYLILISIAIAALGVAFHKMPGVLTRNSAGMPKASILLEAVTFALTLGTAALIFPRMWRRTFGETIHWNPAAARAWAWKLALTGIGLSILAQLLESFLTLPKEMPIDDFFKRPSDVWTIAIFGTLVAPVCEEIFFRGFLLRGFAIFFDWFSTPRNEEGRNWWLNTDEISNQALIASGVLTSGIFAAMHAAQLGFAWNAVGVLWVVGGALTFVRIRLDSVAASSVVHACYNGFLFAVMFFATDGFRHFEKLANH